MIRGLNNTHSQGRVSGAETNMLSSLGEGLKLDPELAKLAGQEGGLPADFKRALQEMSFEDAQKLVEQLSQETENAKAKQELLNQKLKDLLPENVERIGGQNSAAGEGKLSPELRQLLVNKRAPSDTAAQASKQAGTAPWEQVSRDASEAAKNVSPKNVSPKTAEDASKAFAPKRKSIFAVQKDAGRATNGQTVSEASLKEAVLNQNLKNQNLANQSMQKHAANAANGAVEGGKQASSLQNTQGLVDLNQFMAKQTAAGKQRAADARYANERQSIFADKALAQKRPDLMGEFQEAPALESEGASLEEWSHARDQLLAKAEKNNLQTASNAGKVFDLASLNKSSNNLDAVISQIQDYVAQVKAAKEPSAQMTFNHPELGDVDVLVRKGAGEQVHISIGHQSREAAKFFKQHQGELLQSLQQSGVQVGEFKLESSSSSNNGQGNQNSSEQNGKQQFAGQQNRPGQEQRQRNEDSHRREELWNLLHEQRKTA